MSDETLILAPESFSINISGVPLTCLPAAGTVATMAPLSDDAVFVEGMNGCGAITLLAGRGFALTVNVLAFSSDHAKMDTARSNIRSKRRGVTVVGSYMGAKWVSGMCAIQNKPPVNVVAGPGEFVPIIFIGNFTIAIIGKWIMPDALGAGDIS